MKKSRPVPSDQSMMMGVAAATLVFFGLVGMSTNAAGFIKGNVKAEYVNGPYQGWQVRGTVTHLLTAVRGYSLHSDATRPSFSGEPWRQTLNGDTRLPTRHTYIHDRLLLYEFCLICCCDFLVCVPVYIPFVCTYQMKAESARGHKCASG